MIHSSQYPISLTKFNPSDINGGFIIVWYCINCTVLKNNRFRLLLLFLVMSLSLSETKAQKTEFGGGVGVATYTGDIIRQIDPGQIGLQGTLFGRRNFDNVWTLRGGVSFARLNAADSVRPIDAVAAYRDAGFRGSLFEASAVMEYHFLDYTHPQSIFRYSPYGFFGLGYAGFVGTGRSFAGDPDSGSYSAGSVVIPFGIGIKYRLDSRWTLAAELGFRATFMDYLDKIDERQLAIQRFPDPNNPNAPFGYNQGNRSDRDWYYFLGLTLSYSINSVKCYAY